MKIACLAAVLLLAGASAVRADEDPNVTGATARKAAGAPATGLAARVSPERRRCREQAQNLKLFGLGRHKFLQRCRAGRRPGAAAPGKP